MIEWLSSWLKQIILLVLIATFLDLLLPNNAMDRYVKLVMGLLIIMAILSPLLQLIHSNLDLSSLALSDKYENGKQMDSVEQIKERSTNLKKSQEAFVQTEVESSLGQTVTQEITQQFPVEVIQTNVQIQNPKEKNARIKKVQVMARLKPSITQGTSQEMKPVEPVIISNHSIQTAENRDAASNAKRLEITRKITQYLQQTWHLLPGQINVRVDPV